MGLFNWNPVQSIQHTFQDPLKEGTKSFEETTLPGAVMKGYLGKKPNPPAAGEDPNVTALRNRLFGEAQSFGNDLPGLKQEAGNQIQHQGDYALSQGLKSTDQNFNRRGLLYSGLREAGEQGKVASTMASQRAQSNQDLDKMSQAKYQKAANVGLQSYQDAVNREADISSINLQNQVARAQMMQQLGTTSGYMAGSFYGRGGNSSSDPYSSGINSNYTPNFSQESRNGNLRADSDYYNDQRIPF